MERPSGWVLKPEASTASPKRLQTELWTCGTSVTETDTPTPVNAVGEDKDGQSLDWISRTWTDEMESGGKDLCPSSFFS